jgi:hypothetical protein
MTDEQTHSDPVAAVIAKKRRELQKTRAELEKQIKAIDASIAVLGKAIAVFDPSTKIHLDAHGLKPKRFAHTRRFVLSIMREADGSLTAMEIAEAWMRQEQVEDTKANRRSMGSRVKSCLQNCKVQGIVERDGDWGWRLVDETLPANKVS